MNNKDAYKLFLILAVILGGTIRFLPVVMAGFPVNDGGMFSVMVEELKANHFLLPAFTQYNLADIPFAYPPFGLYVTALVSSLFRIPALDVVRWLPALVSTFSLLAFYSMANRLLHSRIQAALATLFYALVTASFGWAIMGGGITRSFGLLFLFLTVASAERLFTRTHGLLVAQTALFGALAFLSHPETGIQAAAVCILLWLFRGRSKNTLLWSLGVSFGVVLLTAPWWGTVMSQHGLAPFQSALHSSNDGTLGAWVGLITLQLNGGIFFNLAVALGLAGTLAALARREFFLPVWLVLPLLVDPRSANGITMIPMAILAGYGFDQVLAPALLALRNIGGAWITDRFVTLSLFTATFYLFFSAGIFGVGLAGGSLSTADRETIAWVDANIPARSNFLLLTGEQYSMKDPFQEWFPALAEQRSQTTLQGAEWTLAEDFFPHYGELVTLQHCSDVACIKDWGERTGISHQYLFVRVLPEGSQSPLRESLALLMDSVRTSNHYELAHETENAVIFAHKP
jgi:hypothetical protein